MLCLENARQAPEPAESTLPDPKQDAREDAAPERALESLAEIAAWVRDHPGTVRLHGVRGGARAAVLARLVQAHGDDAPMLIVANDAKETDALVEALRQALGEPAPDEGGRVRPFPHPDAPLFDRFSPQPFVVAQRMDVLYRLAAGEAPVVVAPWAALALRVPARGAVLDRSVRVGVRQALDRDELAARLVRSGYTRQPVVEERGEFAVRGGILDVFPPHRARPVRVELLGDEIESIREFDPASQRSQQEIAGFVAAPPREILGDRDLVVERTDAIRDRARKLKLSEATVSQLLDTLLRGALPPGAEAMSPLLQPELETFFDFLPAEAGVALVEPEVGHARLDRFATEVLESYDAARDNDRLVCEPEEVVLPADAVRASIAARGPAHIARLEVQGPETALSVRAHGQEELAAELRGARQQPRDEGALAPLTARLVRWEDLGHRVVLAMNSLSSAERVRTLLDEYGVATTLTRDPAPLWTWSAPGEVEVRIAALPEGFALPAEKLAVVTEEEIFGPRERRRRTAATRGADAALALERLATGDLLVHAEHGIGIYRGLVMLELGGVTEEMLRLEYEGGDKLFLPVHRLNLVQRYVGSDGAEPRLDRLGGQSWEKTKRAVKKSMRDMARELLAVHAARELAPGHAFSPRDRAMEEFEAAFPYEETPDQKGAIDDALADLQQARPMDRLVCGDVGYGKTEVAARAAYRAVMDGRQVAVLVPTTVLCQQHFETFEKRFEGTGARIESLSRFRSPKDSRKVLEGLADGSVDLVVGTHRLLQKSVSFRDLGLLVVDEEHRFGVAHKERIKTLKKTVDVLTLTATPIPRTLQMAFTGLRDLSVIDTPPPDRLAIRTQVCRFDQAMIREAILREVRRGGQVFFVHNRVRTIASLAELLERVVPEVSVIVAHGQMKERELEDKMMRFLHGEADVLLCTTIIESGLDIPRANTILIDRADALGLAQLYQLRGRVGRSTRRAYAYLLVPGEGAMTRDAVRRLEAIQDLTELGSGYRLANMDLEIRGAGNLLGAEQSGNMGAVGYETYMELLEEAIEELKGGHHDVEIDPEIRLPVGARLPDDYVTDVSQRLVLYKRLGGARDEAEAAGLRDELLDRFGPLPDAAQSLLRVIHLKIRARRLGVVSVSSQRGEIVLQAAETSHVDPQRLVQLMAGAVPGVRVTPDHEVRMAAPGAVGAALFDRAEDLLDALEGPGASR